MAQYAVSSNRYISHRYIKVIIGFNVPGMRSEIEIKMDFGVVQASHRDRRAQETKWSRHEESRREEIRHEDSARRIRSSSLSAIATPACLGLVLALVATAYPPKTLAHQTRISDGVGGTHHIEPNDTPRAGEPSQTWFTLTQAGGKAIGLSDCDCKLAVVEASGEPIAQPSLSAIAVEGLTDVPAAEVTFPTVGAYVLQLSGEPRGEAAFPAFQLDFPITVAAGQTAVTSAVAPSPAPAPNPADPVRGIRPTQVTATVPGEAEANGAAAIARDQPLNWVRLGAGLGIMGLGILGAATIWWQKRA